MQGEVIHNPRGMRAFVRDFNKQLIQVDAIDQRVDCLEARLGYRTELDATELFAAGLMYSAMVDILQDTNRADRGISLLPVWQQKRIWGMVERYREPVNGGLYRLAPSRAYTQGELAEGDLAILIPRVNLKLAGFQYLKQLADDEVIDKMSPRYHAVGIAVLARIGLIAPGHPKVKGEKKIRLVETGFNKRARVNSIMPSSTSPDSSTSPVQATLW